MTWSALVRRATEFLVFPWRLDLSLLLPGLVISKNLDYDAGIRKRQPRRFRVAVLGVALDNCGRASVALWCSAGSFLGGRPIETDHFRPPPARAYRGPNNKLLLMQRQRDGTRRWIVLWKNLPHRKVILVILARSFVWLLGSTSGGRDEFMYDVLSMFRSIFSKVDADAVFNFDGLLNSCNFENLLSFYLVMWKNDVTIV